jgi:hypothetical protein
MPRFRQRLPPGRDQLRRCTPHHERRRKRRGRPLVIKPQPTPQKKYVRTGVSVNRLYGFEQFNLQNTFRCGGIRRRGSADDLVGLEEELWGNGEA